MTSRSWNLSRLPNVSLRRMHPAVCCLPLWIGSSEGPSRPSRIRANVESGGAFVYIPGAMEGAAAISSSYNYLQFLSFQQWIPLIKKDCELFEGSS
jgi:hypothetical protein